MAAACTLCAFTATVRPTVAAAAVATVDGKTIARTARRAARRPVASIARAITMARRALPLYSSTIATTSAPVSMSFKPVLAAISAIRALARPAVAAK
eukprot:7511318-Alexandrium_andersonii.AAC.1